MENPFASPIYVMAKPAGSMCNLACEYCYYLDKANYYGGIGKKELMSEGMLERFTQQYIAANTTGTVQFTWHGGEALMRPLDFYRKALQLQRKFAGQRRIENCIQTNGLLLNDEWCRFLKQNNWLVGLSIDGPRDIHDYYRRNRAGRQSYERVLRAVQLLQRHGVEWNAMGAINDYNGDFPVEFYDSLVDIGAKYIQFTPVVERDERGNLLPFCVEPGQWGDFLIGVFDRWVRKDVGRIFVQIFDATLANWAGVTPGLCTLSNMCGHAAALEHNGDLYSCDHFVFPEYLLGNINDRTILEMMTSERQLDFGARKRQWLPRECRECEFLFACHGECPKNRLPDGRNFLCEGYKKFFIHVKPYMDFMKSQLDKGLPPADVMQSELVRSNLPL